MTFEQETLFDDGIVPVARRTDPGTSWAAARSVRGIRESHRKILAVVELHGPITDEGIRERLDAFGYRISPSGARTRRSELRDLGYVKDSGLRARLPSGRWAIRWERA